MKLALFTSFVTACAFSIGAQAITLEANLWKLPELDTYVAAPGAVPTTVPDVVFESPTTLDYYFGPGSVGDWIADGGGTVIVENTPGTLASLISEGGSGDGTLVQILGCISVKTGQEFTFEHDDGMYLNIGGFDLDFFEDPTAPLLETKTYTGPSGVFTFELIYTENHSGPAVLVGDLPGVVRCPDGGTTAALLGMAMVGMGWIRRKSR